ncbi:MAG TPA: alpha/beta hydrolase-fold protein [Mucilaginibacter sp.]|jgi:predicted alpha/beta superfamily hydrolase|nr:alpha/beta hydrolase-fold protein [Mucilaginibacter sp.]
MSLKKHWYGALFIITVCLIGQNSFEQALPGKKDSLNSAILGQKRLFQVVLPRNYKPDSTAKYDVIYVLNGDWNTKTMVGVQQFIEDEAFMPPVIIVGVLNIDRDKDLTPTHVSDNKTSGGAAQFLGFLKNELIPYIDKTYPSDGYNVLFGHSFGGLFVTWALLNDPKAFQSYIAADPSFWWDKNYMNHVAVEKLPGVANMNKTLFITGRQDALDGMGIPPMDSIFKKYTPAGFAWKLSAYTNETHGSVRLKSMYDGLRFTYDGYTKTGPEFHPMNGIVLKDKPYQVLYVGSSQNVHYTTDGTEPTAMSPKMEKEFMLSGPATLVARSFSFRGPNDKSTTGVFRLGDYLAPAPNAKNLRTGGLRYRYYEGEWNKLPDFSKLKPVKSGIADSTFSLDKLPAQNNFGLLLDGQIEVKEDGYYLFGLISDDGSKLYLDNQLLIDNDGLHGSDDAKSYIVPLKKGFYPIKIEYFQKDGGHALNLVYLTPSTMNGKNPAPIPWALQYSTSR